MKVYLIKNTVTNKYYLKKGRWHTKIFCESYFTEQAAKWHRTYQLNSGSYYGYLGERFKYKPEDIVIEEYEMIKV